MSSKSSQSKSRREQGGGISLFPFLAVLICTMGALLVLLVVLSHQANERRRLAAQNQTSANACTQNSQNISADTVTDSAKDAEMGITPTDSVRADSVGELQPNAESQQSAREVTRRKNLQLRTRYAASRQRLAQLETQLKQLNEQIAQNEKFCDFPDDLSTSNAPQPPLLSEEIKSLQIELERHRDALETMRSASLQTLQTQQADELLRQQLLETESERQRLLGQIEQQKSLLAQTRTQMATILAEKQATETQRDLSDKRGTLGNVENIASSAETITEGKPVYSIVPYAGANGVRRRPIYLECRRDGIFLQPEGVRFDVSDFANLESKNQPLTIALGLAESAIRTSQTGVNPSAERPYVLLLVRPNGIAAYYAARAALDGHEGDYGYEMIGSDWEMTYPEADPQLRQAITLAVDAARAELRKQQMLATLAASNTPTSLADTSVLLVQNRSTALAQSDHNPTMATGGMSGSGDQNGPELTIGNGYSVAGGTARTGIGEDGQNGMEFVTETGTAVGGMAKSSHGGLPPNERGTERREFADGGFDQLVFGDSSPRNSSGADDWAMDNGTTDDGFDEAPFGVRGSRRATDRSDTQVATRSGKNVDASTASGSTSGSADSPSGGASDSESRSFFSLASTRGKNWGLPDAVSMMSPVSRPIRAVCAADRITLPRNSQTRKVPEIALTESTSRAMDDLVSAVWDHMKTWGFAGRQMYWKPVLHIEVLPGAESRFQEIASLLAGSGIEIRRVEASSSAQTSHSSNHNASISSAASSASSTILTR